MSNFAAVNAEDMADNFLEKRFEALEGAKKVIVRRSNPSLDTLLRKNRSTRGYDSSVRVNEDKLLEIIAVNCLVASARNAQRLRFRPVFLRDEVDSVTSNVNMGAALPSLGLPFQGTEPPAYIVVCAEGPEDKYLDIDLGISLQSMSLKAVELGLNCLIICAFNKTKIKASLNLDKEPLAILAVGKGIEKVFLMPVDASSPLDYYRKDGVHFVPKLKVGDITL